MIDEWIERGATALQIPVEVPKAPVAVKSKGKILNFFPLIFSMSKLI